MRSNIVSEAGLPTRFGQWWSRIPFITSGVVIICGIIYLVCLLVGYDSFLEICFLPSSVISHFQVYRIYTSILFHGSLLHVLFNMMALVPLGSELERIMGSLRLLHLTILLATSNAIFHLLIATVAAYNPLRPYQAFMDECGIGFSGILFSMIVIETSLSGVQSRSVFGLFSVPAKWYAWILLVVFQLLMTNVSLLGHLCGILSGFAYTYGLFNYILPGSSLYSSIESSSVLSACVRRPRYILCTGAIPYNSLPTRSNASPTSSGLVSGDLWRNLSSWMPQRQVTDQILFFYLLFKTGHMLYGGDFHPNSQDSRFPGRGRTLGSVHNHSASVNSGSNLEARLLDDSTDNPSETEAVGTRQHTSNERHATVDSSTAVAVDATHTQVPDNFHEVVQKLVTMGFEKTQAEVALTAADGDPNVAVEILMSQQG